MATKREVTEVLSAIKEAAEAFLSAKNGQRVAKAHELRKAANRLYAIEKKEAK